MVMFWLGFVLCRSPHSGRLNHSNGRENVRQCNHLGGDTALYIVRLQAFFQRQENVPCRSLRRSSPSLTHTAPRTSAGNRDAKRASAHRQRATGFAPAAAGARAGALRVHSERGAPMARSAFAACWRGSVRPPRWGLAYIRTCCAMPAASSWQTRVSIRDRCSITSATRTSSTPCATPSCRQTGSEASGRTD